MIYKEQEVDNYHCRLTRYNYNNYIDNTNYIVNISIMFVVSTILVLSLLNYNYITINLNKLYNYLRKQWWFPIDYEEEDLENGR